MCDKQFTSIINHLVVPLFAFYETTCCLNILTLAARTDTHIDTCYHALDIPTATITHILEITIFPFNLVIAMAFGSRYRMGMPSLMMTL